MNKVRVIKFGGSLFVDESSPARLRSWMATQPTAKNVLIAGGGELVDIVRKWDRRYKLPARLSHQMAMSGMGLTSQLLASWIPGAIYTSAIDEISESHEKCLVFDAGPWVVQNPSIPETWDFTSDSVSAVLACHLDASELVLLKSSLPTPNQVDFFDPLFAEFVTTDFTRVVNLSSDELDEIRYPFS